MKRHFNFDSSDKTTKIHGIEWKPAGKPRAVLQLVHGMVEYIDRYDHFANYLTRQGFCVIGHDHLGHGQSVSHENQYGFFHETHGNRCLIQDIHRLRQMIDKKYKDIPHLILGHSMGSFLLRQYLMYYAEGLDGAIIMGTGYHPTLEVQFGKLLCRGLAAIRGWDYRSNLVNFIAVGQYNTRFRSEGSQKGWVTSHQDIRTHYEADPLCSFIFTLNGFYTLMDTLDEITHTEYLDAMPKELPLLFVSGSQDPVGQFEKGVRKVYHQYRVADFRNLRLKFFENARHEVLNERCMDETYQFIYDWMMYVLKHR